MGTFNRSSFCLRSFLFCDFKGAKFVSPYWLLALALSACLPAASVSAAEPAVSVVSVASAASAASAVKAKAKAKTKTRAVGEEEKASSINLNKATASELAAGLRGVGLKRARDIVVYREKMGGFSAPEQLMDVKGIGKSVFQKNRSRLVLK